MLKRRALFGGTFDPVHRGHLEAAGAVRDALGLKDFRFIPAGDPPHRDGTHASATHRLKMLQLALGQRPEFSIDTRELDRAGPSWMSVTLESLREQYPGDALILLLGQDAANGLERWHAWRSLPEQAHLLIMSRPGEQPAYGTELAGIIRQRTVTDPEALGRQPAGLVYSLSIPPVPVSSTQLRNCVDDPAALRRLVPGNVAAYIEQHGLYRRTNHDQ